MIGVCMYCDKIQDSTSTSVKSPEAEQESSSFFFAALNFVLPFSYMNLCLPPKKSSNMVMASKKPYVSVYKQKPSPKASAKGSPNGKANGAMMPPKPKPKDPSQMEEFKTYGKHQFSGKVADEYLKKQGSSAAILKDPSWVKTSADIVAAAVLDW